MQSVTSVAQQIDRKVRGILKGIDVELLSREDREHVRQLKLACNEVKLDVRDYEYAETRAEQVKWQKLAKHNIRAFESRMLLLGDIFGPVDVAELSAQLQLLQSNME